GGRRVCAAGAGVSEGANRVDGGGQRSGGGADGKSFKEEVGRAEGRGGGDRGRELGGKGRGRGESGEGRSGGGERAFGVCDLHIGIDGAAQGSAGGTRKRGAVVPGDAGVV